MKLLTRRKIIGSASFCSAALSMVWYRSVFVSSYGVLDDYRLVEQARSGIRPFRISEGHAATELVTGRFVPSLLFTVIWRLVDDVSDLKYLRLMAFVVVVSALASLAYFAAQEFDLGVSMTSFTTFVIVLLGVLLPGSVATVTWAQKATQLLALPAAVGAGVLATRFQSMTICKWSLVCGLLVLSVFSYQHFVMMSTLPLAIAGLNRFFHNRDEEMLKRTAVVTIACCLILLINYRFVYVFDSTVIGKSSFSFYERVMHLFTQTLPFAIHLRIVKDPLLVSITAALGIASLSLLAWVSRAHLLLVVAVLYSTGLSALISLGANREINYRMAMPIQLTAWLGLLLLMCVGAQKCWGRRARLGAAQMLLISIVIAFVGHEAMTSVNERIVKANTNEWAEVLDNVQVARESNAGRIILQMEDTPLSGRCAVYSEIGLLGRHVAWVLEDQYRLAIRAGAIELSEWSPKVTVTEELPEPISGVFQVDLAAARDC
jgi:hypothetical protein